MFDESTWTGLPRNVFQSHGVPGDLLATANELCLPDDPFLATSLSPGRIADDRVCDQFDGITSTSLSRASFESVERVIDAVREAGAGHLIALGGGKLIDVAKMASNRLDCDFISVPTAASHDGIVSGRSLIPEGDTRHLVVADPPLTVVTDTELLAGAPWELITTGCTDIISNYTTVKDWRLARYLKNVKCPEYAGAPSQAAAKMLAGDTNSIKPSLEEPAWIMMKAFVSSGIATSIAGSPRPASDAERLFSHQLDRITFGSALHGHQVGVGSIMTEYFHNGARDEWTGIRGVLSMMGALATADKLGIGDRTIIEALATAHEVRDRYTALSNGVSKEAAIEAATITGAI